MTGTGLGIVTLDGGTVTVTVLVLARVEGVVGGVDGPTGTPGMISVELTVVEVELEVDVAGGGDSSEQALTPRAATATDITTMDFNMIAECPAVRTGKPVNKQNCPLP
ncbi:Uncharacterised protein [Mycobacteroides abscessus subsp. abscessus]|nr:Uncharacterised protein [Mycobacteroides abscessus subsp. abscessus]